MAPDRLLETLSRYFDGELPPDEHAEIEQLVTSSDEARHYLDQAGLLRSLLRDETAETAPDVTTRVLAAIDRGPERRPARRLRVAAAFVAGVFGGVVFIGLALRQPTPVAVAEIPEQVLAAQSQVTSLTANLQLVERGWHPDIDERTFTGSISYRAPESLWIEIEDDTEYPADSWVPNHSTYVVDENNAWSSAVAGCPTEALPSCTPALPRVSVVHNREPFPDAAQAPLDLVVPVAGFSRAEEPEILGYETIGERPGVGVEVTAAQVAALLDGLTRIGNWREIHPTDRVELWLDRDALVPLAFTVYPADTEDRGLWAVRHGYQDSPETAILEVTWSDLSLGEPDVGFPTPPRGVADADLGFVESTPPDLEALTPGDLPVGMTMHRSGTVTTGSGTSSHVVSWSDGRSWLKLRWTRDWDLSRLFGDLGALVREAPAGPGVVYLNERGDRIGVHGEDLDVVLTGSLPTGALLDVAASLDVIGHQVPETWAESATATVDDARSMVDGFKLPTGLEGFEDPAIHVEPGVAIVAFAGPGNRGFLLTQDADGELAPPLEAKVRGVTVQGNEGRYTPERGLLEWVEGDLTVSLTSTTLSLEELIVIGESLREP